jgi:hypothetical protein
LFLALRKIAVSTCKNNIELENLESVDVFSPKARKTVPAAECELANASIIHDDDGLA